MEFGIQNLLFGTASLAVPALIFGYFVAWILKMGLKPDNYPIRKRHVWAFTVIVLVLSFFHSYTTYGPRVKATGLDDIPSAQYTPERQQVETGKKLVDSGPKRLGQFDKRIKEEPLDEEGDGSEN